MHIQKFQANTVVIYSMHMDRVLLHSTYIQSSRSCYLYLYSPNVTYTVKETYQFSDAYTFANTQVTHIYVLYSTTH